MVITYKKLWKLLIDKDMKKKELCELAGISPASITKMGKNGGNSGTLSTTFSIFIVWTRVFLCSLRALIRIYEES